MLTSFVKKSQKWIIPDSHVEPFGFSWFRQFRLEIFRNFFAPFYVKKGFFWEKWREFLFRLIKQIRKVVSFFSRVKFRQKSYFIFPNCMCNQRPFLYVKNVFSWEKWRKFLFRLPEQIRKVVSFCLVFSRTKFTEKLFYFS